MAIETETPSQHADIGLSILRLQTKKAHRSEPLLSWNPSVSIGCGGLKRVFLAPCSVDNPHKAIVEGISRTTFLGLDCGMLKLDYPSMFCFDVGYMFCAVWCCMNYLPPSVWKAPFPV